MNSSGTNATNFGAPPAFLNRQPSGPTLSTAITTKQIFLDSRSSRPVNNAGPFPRIRSNVYGLRPAPNNGRAWKSNAGISNTRGGQIANYNPSVSRTKSRGLFPSATRAADFKSSLNGQNINPENNPDLSTSGVPLRNLRPCGDDRKNPAANDNAAIGKARVDTCPVDCWDYSQTVGGGAVPAPYGQSKESAARYASNGNLESAPHVTSSASSQDNGTHGFVKNLIQGGASTLGYSLPATNTMTTFFGKSSTTNGNDIEESKNDGRLIWLSGQKTSYDSQNNIRGRPPFQSQCNPIIFTNSDADFYSQSF